MSNPDTVLRQGFFFFLNFWVGIKSQLSILYHITDQQICKPLVLYIMFYSGARSAGRCLWIIIWQHHGREESNISIIVPWGRVIRRVTAHNKQLVAFMGDLVYFLAIVISDPYFAYWLRFFKVADQIFVKPLDFTMVKCWNKSLVDKSCS